MLEFFIQSDLLCWCILFLLGFACIFLFLVYPASEDLAAIPELEKSYPEFSNWKELPAWGFYIRHADGVEFKNVTLKVLEEDYRPAIVADDVNGLKLDGVKIIQKDAEGKEQIITNQCKEITITE